MRASTFTAFVVVAAFAPGCVGSAPPAAANPADGASPNAASPAPTASPATPLDKFVTRVSSVSAAAQLLKAQPGIEDRLVFAMALDADGKVAAGPRESLAFDFETVPWQEGMPGGKDGFVALKGALGVDAKRRIAIAMAFTGKRVDLETTNALDGVGTTEVPTQFESVRILIAREAHDAPSKVGRLTAAKLWNLVGENVETHYERAAFDAIAIGTKLLRHESPPSFSHPGAGTWMLLRLVDPGDAYLAIDFATGKGEFIPKVASQRSDAGVALFKVL